MGEKKRIDKLDFIKVKNFCFAKVTVQRIKRETTDREKTSLQDVSAKGL